ncbi:MAG: hypothetical protein FWG91_04490 [Lachnospiraceae bacterium]|nr:hypothetical protein [Lachnospiraceae bacterium]
MVDYKIIAVQSFPELKGHIYNELNKVTEAKFSNADVLGFYQPGIKKITISKRIAGNEKLVRETVAHELGHALSEKPRNGFNTTTEAFDKAYHEWLKTNPKATERSFANAISSYAEAAKAEAFAEAFMDFTVNGKNAADASKLIMNIGGNKE